MSRRKTNGNKEKQRFSIKKISGRTASVLIGFTIFGGLMLDAPKAKADTNNNYNVTTNSISAESTSNTDKVVTLTSNADKTNQNAADVTSQSADKMGNDSMNQDSSNTPTQSSESTATSNSTNKENVDSTTSSNENKPTDTTVTNTKQENSASNKVKPRSFVVRTANKYDVDDIYNYYHDKGSNVSKERIQKLIDYKNNLESVTTILDLKKTDYGDSWVNQALEKQIANGTTLTDAFVDRIIGTFGERLVNDTNPKIDTQIEKIKTLQNQYPNSPDVKDALEKLNAAKEQVTPENVLNADKMKDVIDTLNKYGSPSDYEKLAEKAKENPNGNNQALDEAKQKAKDAIDNLNNLNKAQKEAAKAAVNKATDAAGVTAASDQATALDGNMGNLKKSVADVDATKASVNYTNADEEAQKAYDAAVEAANAIVAKEGTNADSAEVQAALEEVKAAKAALNGDSNLANAKQAAQDAIDKLNNLNEAQKAAAKVAVNNATDAAGVTAASDQATALDGNMGDLKESVADVDTTKASVNYTNADEAAQKAYDAAVEAANAIVAKEGTNADSAEVQAALEEVKAAKAALNGDSNLANAKQAAQDAIDKLNNLNEAQKAAAKAAIEQASSLAEVSTASDKATNLDSSMGDLKKASIDSESIKNNVEYVNASADKQKAFDDAMKAASDVLNGKQADYKTVLDLIISLSNAKDNLDGAKKFNNSKQVAKVVIDNLANLNDAQKVTAKKEIDSATQENAITTAVNKAKNLDDLMIKLHAAIEVAAQTRVTVRYLNASPELREAYDKVVKLSKEVVTKNGNDANANDIQLLLQALETAQNALNGKEIVTPDSSQNNQTDSNSDSKLENKTANPSKATATAKNKVSTSEKLPQTGDTSDNNVSIIGATLASIAGLFGLGSLYKKKEDK
ncbi:YSIRK-type signal peptide-containing protein [Ligilactobacillus salivarius]